MTYAFAVAVHQRESPFVTYLFVMIISIHILDLIKKFQKCMNYATTNHPTSVMWLAA